MGGRARVLEAAREAARGGDLQYSAELTTFLVRIDRGDMDARRVKASAFRRLGYAQINANWRNYYLASAMELDDQVPTAMYLRKVAGVLSPALAALPPQAQVEALPPRLRAEEAFDEDLSAAIRYTGAGPEFALHLRHGILEVRPGAPPAPVFVLEVDPTGMGAILAGGSLDDAARAGTARVTGDRASAERLLGLLEKPFRAKPEVVVR
jgi:alkyl sulfatase BDS1-like metallo-beta-lactamase superfamily hydrolase